jgi:Tol biopolymer transport system component
VAVEVSEADGSTQIYVMDLENGMAMQLTFEGTENRGPVWTPDGRDVLFRSNRGDSPSIWRKAADGTGEATHVLDGTDRLLATEVLPNGVLLYQDQGEGGGRDILLFDLAGNGPATPFLATAADEFEARASPDGAWIAYLSDKAGGENWTYVRPYSITGGGERTVAAILSAAPVWSRSGDEVFLLTSPGVALASAAVTSNATTLTPAKPERLFDFDTDFELGGFAETPPYDVMLNGDLIAVLQPGPTTEASETSPAQPTIRVVVNWFEELKRLVPTN